MKNFITSKIDYRQLIKCFHSAFFTVSCGFTLAEVLITLSILGVIATVTVPTAVKNFQNRVTITKLQKAYTTLEGVSANLRVNTGCSTIECVYDIMGISSAQRYDDIGANIFDFSGFKNKMTLSKTVRVYQLYCENQTCGSTGRQSFSKGSIFLYGGDNTYYFFSANPNTITKDINGTPQFSKAILVTVITDNPETKKMRLGRNIFKFIIHSGFQVEPSKICFGSTDCPFSYNGVRNVSVAEGIRCSKTDVNHNSGTGCAVKIMQDGWKMNY